MKFSIRYKLFLIIISILFLSGSAKILLSIFFQVDLFINDYKNNLDTFFMSIISTENSTDLHQLADEFIGNITIINEDESISYTTYKSSRKTTVLSSNYNEYLTELSTTDNDIIYRLIKSKPDVEVITYIRRHPNGSLIILELDLGIISEVYEASFKISVIVSGIILLTGILISLYVSFHITNPLLMINSKAHEISDLDFTTRIDLKNKDEIGDLATTINQISDKLQETLGELEIQNASLIDDKKLLSDLNNELTMLSETDALTQLSNRLKIDKILEIEINRSTIINSTFAVILLDIDYFKSVNDTYGHNVGDEVLKELSQILLSKTRQSDVVGRWGGEEFIIILPDANLDNAYSKAELLRKTIENHTFKVAGQRTSSFGVGVYRPNETIDEVISKVDIALYKAKETGRNKVCLAED